MKIKSILSLVAPLVGGILFTALPSLAGPINIALGKTATQSSTTFAGTADRAVDGNTDGNYSSGSVTHTDIDPQSWWQVDLGGMFFVDQINIWNRTDCCNTRLTGFKVSLLDASQVEVWSFDSSVTPNPEATFTPTVGSSGEFVRVQLDNPANLSLAEVQVFGTAAAAVPEPATMALFGVGLLSFGVATRKHRNARNR